MRLFHLESILVAAQFLALVVVIAAGTAVLVALVYGVVRGVLPDKTQKRYLAVVGDAVPFLFMLALVGGLCGQLGGGSREGVVGALLPALFTLFGGFMAYYLGAKRDRSGKVAVNTLAFVLSFFVVYNVSAIWRQDLEAWDFCRELYSNPDIDQPDERHDRETFWFDYCSPVFQAHTRQPVVAGG